MKVYRGPSTKAFEDDSHELVSSITPEELQQSISEGSYIRFNITKEANERQAVCTAHFENKDIIPMINGIISKLFTQQSALTEVKKILKKNKLTDSQKIIAIQKAIEDS